MAIPPSVRSALRHKLFLPVASIGVVGSFLGLGGLRLVAPDLVADQILRDAQATAALSLEVIRTREILREQASDIRGLAEEGPYLDGPSSRVARMQYDQRSAGLADARSSFRQRRLEIALSTLEDDDLEFVGRAKPQIAADVESEQRRRAAGGKRYDPRAEMREVMERMLQSISDGSPGR